MEKRKNERIPYKTYSVITYNNKTIQSPIDNISLEGIRINSTEHLNPGSICNITVVLEGEATRMTATLTGKVTRSEKNSIALQFTDVSTDSFVHLRNIISNRTMDVDKITKDFEDVDLNKSVSD